MLVIDGVKYKLWTPTNEEKEFHPMIKEHSKEIFGEESLYFDVHSNLRYKLESKSGIASLPDAYVITLSKPYQWFVVENELSTHPVYQHIVPQLMKFINGIKNTKNQKQIVNLLYKEILNDPIKKAYVEKMIATPEIYRFISNLLSNSPQFVITAEKITQEIREACVSLPDVHYVEFQTYVREDAENVRAHIFEPLYSEKRISEEKKRTKSEKRQVPDHYKNWEKMFAWTDANTKEIVRLLEKIILENFSDVNKKTIGRHYGFYKGKPTTKSLFAVFMLKKKALKIRIRTDPKTFRDAQNWTKGRVYKGWFFKTGQEREFQIANRDFEKLSYAI